jgi:hypothetical protein
MAYMHDDRVYISPVYYNTCLNAAHGEIPDQEHYVFVKVGAKYDFIVLCLFLLNAYWQNDNYPKFKKAALGSLPLKDTFTRIVIPSRYIFCSQNFIVLKSSRIPDQVDFLRKAR